MVAKQAGDHVCKVELYAAELVQAVCVGPVARHVPAAVLASTPLYLEAVLSSTSRPTVVYGFNWSRLLESCLLAYSCDMYTGSVIVASDGFEL